MEISSRGINYIKEREGYSLTPYRDSADLPTIGVGHYIKPNDSILVKICGTNTPVRLTEQQVTDLLQADLEELTSLFLRRTKFHSPLTTNEFDMLISFVFNIGMTAFLDSTLYEYASLGKMEDAGDEFLRWIYAKRMIIDGLRPVRQAEKAIFLNSPELPEENIIKKNQVGRYNTLIRSYYG